MTSHELVWFRFIFEHQTRTIGTRDLLFAASEQSDCGKLTAKVQKDIQNR